ncbi:glycosyltransferase family 61 protein [Paenibacillus sp. GYB003]|uniref:glycosyltransferase family 61 protein n=1 Tax=Paenibacillus sp. GYB003 TaxID=2994392 RepID=UPI002F964B45
MSEATPSGVYPTLWHWVERSRAGRLRDHEMQNVIYLEEAVRLAKPKSASLPLLPAFQSEAVSVPKAYVAVLPEGRYWVAENRMAAVIAPDNKIVMDVSMQYKRTNAIHPVYKRRALPKSTYTGETVAVVHFLWDHNYYHWLGDVLARIHLIDRSGIRIDKYIVTGNGPSRFQTETLAMLGIPERKIARLGPGAHLKARRLVVPSLDMYRLLPFVPHSMPGWASRYLRSALSSRAAASPTPGPRRIYVSRRLAFDRKVTNEDEVCRLLERFGFRRVELESLPVAEQIRLFAEADVVAAPHGAGLANLLFCKPGTQVLELFAPNYVNPVYWYLCNQLGLDYYCMLGQGERLPTASGIGDVERRVDDMTIDTAVLTGMLLRMERGPWG